MDNIEKEFLESQKAICKKYNAEFLAAPFDNLIGVALKSFEAFNMPINGLRHPTERALSANWFIWAGEYSDSDDFFQPVHIKHLLDLCPKAINYLGLAPGWRFLFDSQYEDVWYDEQLLNI
ncbi:immunity protein Imm33 domain-containing protein [Pinibacter aurantiacus]|uniref:Imm33-like domain-containing protein n=1 Tax=Pinibacter aurantiacus TaxID=2851599 RepID=A0A9E2SAD8_9BACT|nr:hypothetical protein [Pinibacter aurantiacus]MBV4358901.1 hypothetical protein [Pinibacter aurantiacus]